MKTLSQLKKKCKEKKWKLTSDGYRYDLELVTGSDFTSWRLCSLEESASIYCCGLYDFGQFDLRNERIDPYPYIDGPLATQEQWEVLLQYYIISSKRKYFRCSTLSLKNNKYLEAALKNLKFNLLAKIKSRHSRTYKILIWDLRL